MNRIMIALTALAFASCSGTAEEKVDVPAIDPSLSY